MKKEDYVSLEVAKLLEKKGFEREGAYFWDGGVLCPTLYEAQQWLWQKHRLLVTAFLEAPFGKPYEFIYCIQDAKNSVDNNGSVISEQSFESIQKALNEGILEALKTIDDEKEITKKD